VESSRQILNVQEVVMGTSIFDQYTMGIRDKIIHVGSESSGHHLGNSMNEA
jgi:hypothetical protein